MVKARARRFAVAGLIALIVGVVGGWALSRSSDDVDAKLTNPGVVQDPTIGTNADTRGETFRFARARSVATGEISTPALDGRPTVINFWYSTCPPCREEMPVLAAAARKHSGSVTFIGINPNDTVESATAFLGRFGITYANWLDERGDQLAAARVGTMPTTFFLDPDGRIVSMHAGGISADELEAGIAELGVTG